MTIAIFGLSNVIPITQTGFMNKIYSKEKYHRNFQIHLKSEVEGCD